MLKIININSAESSSSEPVLIWAVNLKIKWSDNLLWITVCWQYSAILNLLSSFIICDFRYITCNLIKYFFFKSCGWCFAQTTKRNYQILFWVTLRYRTNMFFFVNQKLLLPCLKCNFSKRNAVFTLLNLVKETKYVYMIATVLICFYLIKLQVYYWI